MPKVSIVTICFNEVENLPDTIESVLNQSFTDLEYIIIDGSSSDGSKDLIEEYAMEDKRIKWISEKDKGIYDAMNKGIKMATGEWLNFMNAGDSFANLKVLQDINFDEYIDQGLIYGKIIRDQGRIVYPKTPELLKYGKIMACHQAMFFNRSLLGHELSYDSSLILSGDSELVSRLDSKNYKIEYVDILIAYYKGGGISSNFIKKAKYQKYRRVWRYYGLMGILRTLLMKFKLVDVNKFNVDR